MDDVANLDEAKYWDSAESRHWVEYQERHDAVVGPFDAHLFSAAALTRRDHVLDVGCGCGATTRAAARAAAAGEATGFDLSAAMLERARVVAEKEALVNVRFLHGDAQAYPLEESAFDVAISRFGVMFFSDPIAAFANVARATREQGRLAFVCWQDRTKNDWIGVPATAALAHVPPPDLGSPDEPGPFSLADPDRVRSILSAAGWHDVVMQEVKEQLPLGNEVDEAMTFVGGIRLMRALFSDVDEANAGRAAEAVREALAAHETPDGVLLGSGAWVVSAVR